MQAPTSEFDVLTEGGKAARNRTLRLNVCSHGKIAVDKYECHRRTALDRLECCQSTLPSQAADVGGDLLLTRGLRFLLGFIGIHPCRNVGGTFTETCCMNACTAVGGHEPYTCVSSAYRSGSSL